jgi:hypothetical protein
VIDEEAFIEERGIDQRCWRQYTKLRLQMRPVGSARRGRDVPGLLDYMTKQWVEELARGNVRRIMPAICQRCDLEESTVYAVLSGDQCSDMTLSAIEDAVDNLLASERLDVPSVPPTDDDLSNWLMRWVGTYQWLGEFLGVKANTLTSWATRGPKKQRDHLLTFATRWYEARLALWPEKPQEQFEAEYVEYLEARDVWAEEALDAAHELERADLRERITAWERTPAGQLYLEDAQQFGAARARELAFKQGRPHPKDAGSLVAGKLVLVERSFAVGAKPVPPSRYEDRNRDNTTRFGAPAPASELWAPSKKVDA